MNRDEIRGKIVHICRKLVAYSLTYASLGNVSVRARDRVIITPSGIRFDELVPQQLVVTDLNGKIIEGEKPSVELPMHLEIYRRIPDAGAIIHAHAPYATVYGTIMREIRFINEEARVFGVEYVPVCRYAPSGTRELAVYVAEALTNSKAVIIPNHGVVTYGRTLDESLRTLEVVENLSKMSIIKTILMKVLEE